MEPVMLRRFVIKVKGDALGIFTGKPTFLPFHDP
jgi:hypothetical protein